MEFEDNPLDSRSGGVGPMGNFLDEEFEFGKPLVNDGVENFGLGCEESIDIGMGHAEMPRDIHDGEFIVAVAAQKSFGRLKNQAASFTCSFCAHIGYICG